MAALADGRLVLHKYTARRICPLVHLAKCLTSYKVDHGSYEYVPLSTCSGSPVLIFGLPTLSVFLV